MIVFATDQNLIADGARAYTLATSWYWFDKFDGEYDMSKVSLSAIDKAALKTDASIPLVMDIENWNLAKSEERDAGVCNLRVAAMRLRMAHSSMSIGYYGLLPERNYWAPVKQWEGIAKWDAERWKDGTLKMREWRGLNTANAADLLSLVDVVYPSIYPFYPGKPAEWRVYAIANLDDANRISGGKPVMPFVCPQYPDNSMIPADEWRMMLDVVREYGVPGCMVYTYKPTGDEWRAVVVDELKK